MKLAIVCPGGGSRGRWQAGALYALYEMGWIGAAQVLVGTSAGGLNVCSLAAGMIEGRGAEALKQAWAGIRASGDVYTPPMPFQWWRAFNFLDAARRFVWGPSFFDTTPLQAVCKAILKDHTSDELLSLGKVMRTQAFNYKTGKIDSLRGKLLDMALSTSAIEGAFPSWNGYGDGGLMDNQPVDEALAQGADYLMVVYTGPEADAAEPGHQFTGFNNASRALNRAVNAHEERTWKECEDKLQAGHVVHVYPSEQTGDVLDFSNVNQFQKGYDFAKAFVPAEAQRLGWPDPAPTLAPV